VVCRHEIEATTKIFLPAADKHSMIRIPSRPEPAVLTLTSSYPIGQPRSVECFFKWIKGDELVIVSCVRPQVPSRVTVEYSDRIFIGEAIRSVPTPKGWRSEIRVAEMRVPELQSGTQSLINLGKHVWREDARLPQEQRQEQSEPANVPASA